MLASSDLAHGMNTYIPIKNKVAKGNIMKQIMIKNQYTEQTFLQINYRYQKITKRRRQNSVKESTTIWATFTYTLKPSNLKIAFKTTNTLQNHLCNISKPNQQKTPINTAEYIS
jgi:hypothetical protein